MRLNTLQCPGRPLIPQQEFSGPKCSCVKVEKPGLTNHSGPIPLAVSGWQLGWRVAWED